MLLLTSGVLSPLFVVYCHSVGSRKGPTVVKAGRKWRFTHVNMAAQPAKPVNKFFVL